MAAVGVLYAAPAMAQSYKQFGQWLAFCDNILSCSAFGTTPDAASPTSLRMDRAGDAKAQATWTIGWSVENLPPGTRLRLSFDDPKITGLPADPLAVEVVADPIVVKIPGETDPLIAAIRQAHTLTAELMLPAGKTLPNPEDGKAEISLNGAVAALLWIDDQQKRVGTASALIKKGPASDPPPPPAEPLVNLAPAATQIDLPSKPPGGIAKAVKAASCQQPDDQADAKPTSYRLSPSKVLWEATCTLAAYNTSSLYFVAEGGTLKTVSVRHPVLVKGDAASQQEIFLAEFDPKTMELHSLYKGRGPGDCGDEGRWGWDGTSFALLEFRTMPECLGVSSDFWPVVYRAKPQR